MTLFSLISQKLCVSQDCHDNWLLSVICVTIRHFCKKTFEFIDGSVTYGLKKRHGPMTHMTDFSTLAVRPNTYTSNDGGMPDECQEFQEINYPKFCKNWGFASMLSTAPPEQAP